MLPRQSWNWRFCCFVFDGIEEGAIIGRPDYGANPLDFTGQGLAGFEVLDVERVLAKTRGIYGVGEIAAVVGNVGGSNGKKGMACGELVAVEKYFLRCRLASLLRQWMAY